MVAMATTPHRRLFWTGFASALVACAVAVASFAAVQPDSDNVIAPGQSPGSAPRHEDAAARDLSRPEFERMLRDQSNTDRAWRTASSGVMRLEKITYQSRIDDLEIPAFVFQPLEDSGPRARPALVWVHENIRGHLYEHYIPYIRQATGQGYVVIAPEYRGSIGYSRALFDAIDYGGAEVDDVVSAVDVLRTRYPAVDPARIGVIGWSHGGMVALLAIFRNPTTFASAAAVVPVTNLFHRLAWKGVESQRRLIDPHNRIGGTPAARRQAYRERSPLFQVDKLQIPLLVHIADNDRDVPIEEGRQLVDALVARKPQLAETKVYANPPGGHMFDRRVEPGTWKPVDSSAQRDSWSRVWAFLGRTLRVDDDAEPDDDGGASAGSSEGRSALERPQH
jgi:dipeptidyl aminopeptidase/acylaminoacyl peptidase